MQPFKSSLCALLLLSCVGCQEFSLLRSQSPDKEKDKDEEAAEKEDKTEFVSNFAFISGNNVLTLQGIGLVVGLDGTGEDPPPSTYRTALLREMEKHGVKQPNQILKSTNAALVLLVAYLPADIQKSDRFDVEVRLPPGSEATSLAGGWLLEARLSEKAIVPGQGEMKGHEYGKVEGPILISTGEGEKSALAGVLKRGRILGGGVALKDRPLGLYLKSSLRGFRNARKIEERVAARFSYYEKGHKVPLAVAKTDQYIELKVHPRYKENYQRYMQVIRNIAFRETPVQQRDRMETLKEKLANPNTAALAAVQLEAIGTDALQILKKALTNTDPQVRFYAAESLAYFGDEAGAVELANAAQKEPAFRVYCLAALTALNQTVCFQLLRNLLDEPSAETRYGAFRALWLLDPEDPFIRGRRLNDQFSLHVLATHGEPMAHLTRNRRAEVVLFGADQEFSTPLALTAGRINVNAPSGGDTIVLSRFELGQPDRRRVVSAKVADVIVAATEMGATYPDVAQMLSQAARQLNLPGRVEIDALPTAGRLYYATIPGDETNPPKKKRGKVIGKREMVPNMFPTVPGAPDPYATSHGKDSTKKKKSKPKDGSATDEKGEASLSDIRQSQSEQETQTNEKSDSTKDVTKDSSTPDSNLPEEENPFDAEERPTDAEGRPDAEEQEPVEARDIK